MSLASNSSLRAAQEVGFFGYPDDEDDYQSDVAPEIDPDYERLQRDLAMVCGADNERLLEIGYRFDLCDREPGHPGFHQFLAL